MEARPGNRVIEEDLYNISSERSVGKHKHYAKFKKKKNHSRGGAWGKNFLTNLSELGA